MCVFLDELYVWLYGKKLLCRWNFSKIENLLETFYWENHKNMVFYL